MYLVEKILWRFESQIMTNGQLAGAYLVEKKQLQMWVTETSLCSWITATGQMGQAYGDCSEEEEAQ